MKLFLLFMMAHLELIAGKKRTRQRVKLELDPSTTTKNGKLEVDFRQKFSLYMINSRLKTFIFVKNGLKSTISRAKYTKISKTYQQKWKIAIYRENHKHFTGIQFDRQKRFVLNSTLHPLKCYWLSKIKNFQNFDFLGKKIESDKFVIGRFFDRFEFNEGLVTWKSLCLTNLPVKSLLLTYF